MIAAIVALDLLHRALARLIRALQVLSAVIQDETSEERVEGGGDLVGLLDQRVDVW